MSWLSNLFLEESSLQAVIILSIIIACGLGLGKIKVWGVSLGVTFVFFVGIFFGQLGLSINHSMLTFAQNFGLVIFVYALGMQVGPGFFGSFRKEGIQLNILGMGVILLGSIMAVGLTYATNINISDMIGILSGAVTNTPALAAAQQTLQQYGVSSSGAALGCAITYPLGVVGVILAIVIIDKFIVKPKDLEIHEHEDHNHTFIASFEVCNPGIFHMPIHKVAENTTCKFIISRLWRNGKVQIPSSETELKKDDRILVITTEKDVQTLTILFGEQDQRDWNKDDIDWNAIDNDIISKKIIITRPIFNGKKLGSLKLRNHFGISVTRITRNGIVLLATPGLVLQLGDRLTVVGESKSIAMVEKELDSANGSLRDPNLGAIFIGIVLGLILGSIPIFIPGMSTPIKLGLAGGPIITGLLIGTYGPRFKLVTYSTRSANLMIRGIGLSLYLACLGLDSGANFIETVMRPEGLLWIGTGFSITIIPVLVMGWVAMRTCKLDFGHTCGMLCGSMANPMALNYADSITSNDSPSVSYATVYPVGMFARVIIAQVILTIFLQ
ncbi:MAG: putative transporter [Bacteroidaceae bacterium]|nr:putative transporter [Bacteroidaceae bacterium]